MPAWKKNKKHLPQELFPIVEWENNIEQLSPTSAKSPAHFAWNLQLWVSWVITFDESAMVVGCEVHNKNPPPRKLQTQPPKYDLNKAPN